MLDKNPKTRLGSPLTGGVEAIKKHSFFNGIDWDKVLTRGYKPPIRPKANDEGDYKNIDGQFLNESIKNTPDLRTAEVELLN